MLPDHLYSSYKRYKADTDYIANWLATTALRSGYVPIALQSNAASKAPKSSRLKGKARKLAQTASQTPTHAQTQPTRIYRIEIEEFVSLAEFIAKSPNLITEKPRTFAYVLQCCIRERSRHLAYHSESGIEALSLEGDLRHDHFIRVLQQVQATLRPILPELDLSAGMNAAKSQTDSEKRNMFEKLSVDEPSDPTDYSEKLREPMMQEILKFNAAPSSREEELAAAMLFLDAHRLREVVQRVWHLYHESKLDLMAASLTTNSAIDFMRSIQIDFDDMFLGRVDLNKKPCYACAFIADQHPTAVVFYAPCMHSARCIFAQFKEAYLDDTSNFVPTVGHQNLGHYDELDSGNKRSLPLQHLFRDLKLAMGVIPELCVLIQTSSAVSAEDELLRGLRQVVTERKEIFWVTFAIQLFLDLRNVLREDVGMGFEQLLQGGRHITRSIKHVLSLHKTHRFMLGSYEPPLRQLVELIELWTESDFVGARRRDISVDPTASAHIEYCHLLKRNPLWCGLLLYSFRMISYDISIVLANSTFSIQATAHLYNYLRQAGLLQQEWIDMEYVMAVHKSNEIFVGDRPCTATDCSKQVLLAYGVSASAFARNKRPTNRVAGSPKKAKVMRQRVPFAGIFRSRFCDNDRRTSFEPRDLEDVIQDVWARKGMTNNSKGMCTSLAYMAVALHEEAEELCFDYLLLHKTCWTILSRLVHDLADTNTDMQYLRANLKHLPESVACILVDAATAESLNVTIPTEDVCTAAAIVQQTMLTDGVSSLANPTRALDAPSSVGRAT